MPATVSIVVPVYNVGSYVDYCVRSVLSQTFPDWEMVLVNDGSSDDSGERCRRWAEVDARISLVNQENAGVSVARNNGLASSTGPYVMFVDPDDWLEPDSLETLLSGMGDGVEICVGDCLLEKHGQTKLIPMINCDQRDFDSNDRQRLMALALNGRGFESANDVILGSPWGKLYLRSFLDENGLRFKPGLKKEQDVLFNLNVISRVNHLRRVPRAVYHYRVNEGSVCNRYLPDFDSITDDILSSIRDLIDENGYSWFEGEFDFKVVKMYAKCLKRQYLHPESPLTSQQRVEAARRLAGAPFYAPTFERMELKGMPLSVVGLVTLVRIRAFGAITLILGRMDI